MDFRGKLDEFKVYADEHLHLSPPQTMVIIVLLVALVTGSSILYLRGRPERVTPVTERRAAPSRPKPAAVVFMVHVGGAVNSPGLYELRQGMRVNDAVKAAGGPAANGDLDALNLAAKISDGQKITVPVKGTANPEVPADAGAASAVDGKIAINTATIAQLDELDGIGPVLAKRIVDYRSKHGPFTRLDQLQNVDGIGPKKLELIKDQIIF